MQLPGDRATFVWSSTELCAHCTLLYNVTSETAYSHKQWRPQTCLQVCHRIDLESFDFCPEHDDSNQKCDDVSNKCMLEIHSVGVLCGICNRSRRPAVFSHDFFPLMSGNGRFSGCFMSDWRAVHAGFRFHVALLPALVHFQPSFSCPWGRILPDHVRQGS